VIHEVDEALRQLVREVALRARDIEVSFDAPTKDWAARRNAPTVNVYLYDIREDMRRRQRGMLNEYGPTGRVAARHLPPRHIKLSYLVTAWTQRPEDEHRLLSALLTGFLRHEAMPAELLSGSLSALGLPVPMTVALPPPEDRAFADVWTALGGELKPSLDVVVSAPIESGRVFAAGPPAEAGLQIELGGDEPVAHRVTPVAPAGPVAGERRVAMVRRAPERR
jgi:Pvc16 N-terminal domain